MARRSTKSGRATATLAGELMLAPAVIAMRLPVMVSEANGVNPFRTETVRAVNEKTAAAVEGMIAAQTSLMVSASRFWFEVLSGRTPSLLNGVAVERAVHAALAPSGREVSSNHRRLSARK